MKKYKIFCGTRLDSLAATVNKKLSEGWELVGGIAIGSDGFYFQAMVRTDSDVDFANRK